MPNIALDSDKKEIDLPDDIRAEIEGAIKLRATGKGTEADAKIMNDQAKTILLPLMSAFGITTYQMEGIGKASARASLGSSINVGKLRENLLLEGLDPKDIDKVIKVSSSTWNKEYVEFKAAGSK